MYLPAISIGYAVPNENFDASVHSVFQSAINLRLARGGELLTLVTSSEANLPQGIRLDAPKDFSFEIFQTGEPASCRDGILQLKNPSLTIQLSRARRWKCDLATLEADTTNPAVASAWSLVWNMLNERQIRSKAEIVAEDLIRPGKSTQNGVPRRAGEAMRSLVNVTRQYGVVDRSEVSALIGLGSGLTPSGDDLLVGYLAGLWCSVRNKSERTQFVSHLGKIIIALLPKTNDISRTYLYHASQGRVSSLLANLAEAISRGENQDRLLEIAEAAMRVGHTSGMDTATGLLIGLTAWTDSSNPIEGY